MAKKADNVDKANEAIGNLIEILHSLTLSEIEEIEIGNFYGLWCMINQINTYKAIVCEIPEPDMDAKYINLEINNFCRG